MDEVFKYVSKRSIETPPWRYRSSKHKESIFAVFSNLVQVRKELDFYITDINEKSINGFERVKSLIKSFIIEKRMEETFLERKFPSVMYEEKRLQHEKEVDRNAEKAFLLNFLCGILKANYKTADWILPSMTAPSFFNFARSNYYLFYRETGYERGETHYNLKYKHHNQPE